MYLVLIEVKVLTSFYWFTIAVEIYWDKRDIKGLTHSLWEIKKFFNDLVLGIQFFYFSGLPTIFHIFAHTIPGEERSRAFGYLVACGSIGQTVASVVSCYIYQALI